MTFLCNGASIKHIEFYHYKKRLKEETTKIHFNGINYKHKIHGNEVKPLDSIAFTHNRKNIWCCYVDDQYDGIKMHKNKLNLQKGFLIQFVKQIQYLKFYFDQIF